MQQLDLTSLRDALSQLAEGLRLYEKEMDELRRDGVIQRFEYSHELSMKFIRRTLETVYGESVDPMPYNDVLRSAAERGLIQRVETWYIYWAARNKTSHTYDAHVAEEVCGVVQDFLADAQFLLTQLEDIRNRPSA